MKKERLWKASRKRNDYLPMNRRELTSQEQWKPSDGGSVFKLKKELSMLNFTLCDKTVFQNELWNKDICRESKSEEKYPDWRPEIQDKM